MPIHGYPGNVITANPTTPTVSSASGVWTTEQQLINQSAGRWPMAATQISRSLRFNSADSAYLNRTPASAGSTTLGTLSNWIKLGVISTDRMTYHVAGTSGNNNRFYITFNADNTFQIVGYNSSASIVLNLNTTQLFRDPSAWYHIVVAIDTTQATSSNRAKLYINGTQVTAFSTATYPSQNQALGFTNNTSTLIGSNQGVGNLFNGYITEVNFIDGQALDPSYFGFNNSDTGVWTPRQYTGAYGTNGFYLNFSDNSNTTAATLGKDYSGNGNNWTPNNFSVTAGAGNDSLVDSPTSYGTDTGAGGEVRGNYCTLNPLNSAGSTLSNGNLDCVTAVSAGDGGRGTIAVTSGKWYWEFTPTNNGNQSFSGIALTTTASSSYYVAYYANTGNKFVIGSGSSAYGATYTNNDVIGVALDLDSGTKTVTFYKNNASQGAITITPSEPVLPIVDDGSGSAATTFNCNFGQRAFAYTAPSGFKALCTQNLPTPTIGATSTTQAGKYFNPVLYTGNGSTQSITGVGFQPDWVWVKSRSSSGQHSLTDVVRGVNKQLFTSLTNAEGSETDQVTAFNSDGFSLGANLAGTGSVNVNTVTYVAWNWKANGAGSSNTAGTITSTVSANTTSGFSIVTYTGNATAGATVGHGLGVTPSMFIVKSRSLVESWPVYHISLGATKLVRLQATNAEETISTAWNNTAPTSTVFSLGSPSGFTNSSGATYVAYCFAPVAGYSAFGSFTGNGSTDGPFVFTNMRPRYLLIKLTSAAGEPWTIADTARSPNNVSDDGLYASSSSAESANDPNANIDILSNGFKPRCTAGNLNTNGATYIYMAFAENPFKYSLAR